jgi:hypothetical protein
MKRVCDNCARSAVGATVFHRRDGLVRVDCDDCHARRISPRMSPQTRRILVALWLVLLATQVPWLISRLSPT